MAAAALPDETLLVALWTSHAPFEPEARMFLARVHVSARITQRHCMPRWRLPDVTTAALLVLVTGEALGAIDDGRGTVRYSHERTVMRCLNAPLVALRAAAGARQVMFRRAAPHHAAARPGDRHGERHSHDRRHANSADHGFGFATALR